MYRADVFTSLVSCNNITILILSYTDREATTDFLAMTSAIVEPVTTTDVYPATKSNTGGAHDESATPTDDTITPTTTGDDPEESTVTTDDPTTQATTGDDPGETTLTTPLSQTQYHLNITSLGLASTVHLSTVTPVNQTEGKFTIHISAGRNKYDYS